MKKLLVYLKKLERLKLEMDLLFREEHKTSFGFPLNTEKVEFVRFVVFLGGYK